MVIEVYYLIYHFDYLDHVYAQVLSISVQKLAVLRESTTAQYFGFSTIALEWV